MMAIVTPTPRIGRYAASTKHPKPANSERQPRNAMFHVKSEMAAPMPKAKMVRRSKRPMGLINR
jgi:hypothetical protein